MRMATYILGIVCDHPGIGQRLFDNSGSVERVRAFTDILCDYDFSLVENARNQVAVTDVLWPATVNASWLASLEF